MREIEVKVLEVDRKSVEAKLRKLGAKKVFDDDIEAIFFDFKDGSIRNAKNTLRLRREGKKVKIAFKKFLPHEKVKVREEVEVEVSDFDEMKRILGFLGLMPKLSMKKHRISYKVDGVLFEFDKYFRKYDYVPEFMEIEAKDAKTIYKYAEKIGFRREDCKPLGGNALIKKYKK